MRSFPIGVRLTAWYFAVLAVVLSLFGVSAYLAMRNSIQRTVDGELQARLAGVQGLINRSSAYGIENVQRELREHSALTRGALLQVSDERGTWLYRSASIGDYTIPDGKQQTGTALTVLSNDIPLRVLSAAMTSGNQYYSIQVAAPLNGFYDALHRFAALLLISIPVLLCCAATGGYWMSRRALAPVDQITNTARSISIQNLSSRLAVPQSHDELQRLSETLNNMLERLEAAFKRVTQFTADASHELRTPVAVMRTRAELALRKPRTVDEYREALARIHGDLENTSNLLEKLMLLARADYGAGALEFSNTNFADAVRDACNQGRPFAEAKQVGLCEDIPKFPVWVRGDAHALRRLLLILIDNAVKYTPSGGRVDVGIVMDNGSAVAVVRDTGIGIAAEDIPNVFERFYRVDKARSRGSGGVGLGLSIGRWIAEAHAGKIEVQSTPGQGSIFQFRLSTVRNGETEKSNLAPSSLI